MIEQNPLMLNAGADINGFAPVTFEEMLENNLEHRFHVMMKRISEGAVSEC